MIQSEKQKKELILLKKTLYSLMLSDEVVREADPHEVCTGINLLKQI